MPHPEYIAIGDEGWSVPGYVIKIKVSQLLYIYLCGLSCMNNIMKVISNQFDTMTTISGSIERGKSDRDRQIGIRDDIH